MENVIKLSKSISSSGVFCLRAVFVTVKSTTKWVCLFFFYYVCFLSVDVCVFLYPYAVLIFALCSVCSWHHATEISPQGIEGSFIQSSLVYINS